MFRPFFILTCTIATLTAAEEIGSGKRSDGLPAPDVALKSFSVAAGLKVELWASEPLLENPVAFSFDHAGRAYIAETNRRRSSTPDIRRYDAWVIPMLGLRTVDDRVAHFRSELAPEKKLKPAPTLGQPDVNQDGQYDWRDMTIESERVKVVEDSDGDGRADRSRVLAEGFNGLATGTGAGVLPLPDGDVLYTCIPDLWRIKPDGSKVSLSTGYGVHVVFSGHDMHGLRQGPDGRIYFTIADCGAHVARPDGTAIAQPDTGGVYRCWPDGSGLELFAKGLRNPQHLAFNDLGDLFTTDNNADGNDKARLIHVVEGADYGWRIGWQFQPKLGPWNTEGMWFLDSAERNAAMLPPVAHISHGPAGFSYYPGTGLPEKYRGHFFLADFPGGVRHFAVKPRGATYEMADFAPDAAVLQNNQASEMTGKLLWNLYPSDVQFAPGGGIMVLDWVQGWEKTGKGRIFRVSAPELEKDPLIAETKKLLNDGVEKLTPEYLARLLWHADQRVRMAAQFALVKGNHRDVLIQTMSDTRLPAVARSHALWGYASLAHTDPKLAVLPVSLLQDKDDEVRAQAARALAEFTASTTMSREKMVELLLQALRDPAPRVRFFAGLSLRKLSATAAMPIIVEQIQKDDSRDPFLRHSLAAALAGSAAKELPLKVAQLPASASKDAQLVNAIASRYAGEKDLAALLSSSEPRVRLETARAIHDEPNSPELPALAALLERTHAPVKGAPDRAEFETATIRRRAVNAAYRMGTAESARILASVASFPGWPEPLRLDALDALAHWTAKLGRDRVLGVVMPDDADRQEADARAALTPIFAGLIAEKNTPIALAAVDASAANHLAPEPILAVINDAAIDIAIRAAALRALDRINAPQLEATLHAALAGKDAGLAEAARRIQINRNPAEALAQIAIALKNGSITDQQEAIEQLGRLEQKQADEQLLGLLQRLKSGKLPASLHLDVLEAAAKRSDTKIAGFVQDWEKQRAKDPLGAWKESLEGGNAKVGREIFAEKAEAACLRCHAVAKQGGDVGPDLAGIAGRHDDAYLLRAIVDPNADIAPGYENLLVTLQDGNVLAGIATSEDDRTLTLKNVADGKPQVVQKSTIKERQKLPSAMPPGLGETLGKRGLRDLLAYLATLK